MVRSFRRARATPDSPCLVSLVNMKREVNVEPRVGGAPSAPGRVRGGSTVVLRRVPARFAGSARASPVLGGLAARAAGPVWRARAFFKRIFDTPQGASPPQGD
jgi:hypothetical protein